ncbi:MAG: hypothetical protein V2G42_07300 [bacterium JZ-2024 1]
MAPKSWQIIGWKLVDLYTLRVHFKPEFNTDNPAIYAQENIVLEVMLGPTGEIQVTPPAFRTL